MPVFYSKRENKLQTFMVSLTFFIHFQSNELIISFLHLQFILRDISPGRAVVFCKNAKTSNFLASMVSENTPLRATSITSRSRRSDVIREVQRFDQGVYQIFITNVPFPLSEFLHK